VTVDRSLQERFRQAQAENARIEAATPDAHLERGGGGSDSGGMDGLAERVTRVEVRLDALDDRLGRLEAQLGGIETRMRGVEQSVERVSAKLDLLTGQVVAKLPTWWQMPAMIAGTLGVLGSFWAVYRYLLKVGFL
jgi:archaellum component FlaC